MNRQPTRTLGHVAARQQHDKAQQRTDEKPRAPAEIDGKELGIEQPQCRHRSQRRADPVAAVDAEVDLAANACRNQLIDRGVDGGVFPADAKPGDDPA